MIQEHTISCLVFVQFFQPFTSVDHTFGFNAIYISCKNLVQTIFTSSILFTVLCDTNQGLHIMILLL